MNTTLENTSKTAQCLNDLVTDAPIRSLEVMIPDINGYLRGKVINIAGDKDLRNYRLLLPYTCLACDYTGDPVAETGLIWDSGDPDYSCTLEMRHFSIVPWQAGRAQVLMNIRDPEGKTVDFDGREVLRRICADFRAKGLTATAAVELEFTLMPEDRLGDMPKMPFSGTGDTRPRLYDVNAADEYQALFADIKRATELQNLPADSLVTEAAPCQFEINLNHVDDPLLAADQAVLLKRLIKGVAKQHGYRASFMAKPFAGYPGNGLHIHLSLSNKDGLNIFSPADNTKRSSDALLHALAGIQRTTAACQILLYPNMNSFKRIAPKNYAPCSTHWGYNNRNVAFRIPSGDPKARRVEHRLAGADANPYLVMAALMMGIDEGLNNPAMPSKKTTGDLPTGEGEFLSQDPEQARTTFCQSDLIAQYFGAEFQRVYAICHASEISRFQNHIMPIEYDWYFDTA